MNQREFESVVESYRECLYPMGLPPNMAVWYSRGYLYDFLDFLSMVDRYRSRGDRILDFGAGHGFFSVLLVEAGYRVSGVDVEMAGPNQVSRCSTADYGDVAERLARPDLLEKLYGRLMERWPLELVLYAGRALPYEDSSFEGVVAHAVLEHIPLASFSGALEEIRRVLREGGNFFVFRTPRRGGYS